MKPMILVSPPMMRPPVDMALRELEQRDLGEIDFCPVDSSWDASLFFNHLRSCGYCPRVCKSYDSLSLTFVNGACRWHTDPGYGLVACWLVHIENLYGDDAQLITRHGPLDLKAGDLCVFDSDQGHGWLSNSPCVMVMATVAKARQGVAA